MEVMSVLLAHECGALGKCCRLAGSRVPDFPGSRDAERLEHRYPFLSLPLTLVSGLPGLIR